MNAADLASHLRRLPPRMRWLAATALAASVALALLAGYAARDTRVALFSTPLRPDQLAEVEQRLAASGTPYLPEAANVRVDRSRRARILLELALAGVPHPHLSGSDEALPKLGALTPQRILEAQARDALAADLALGLRGLRGVSDARVVIAPATGGLFADDQRRDASASVRLTAIPGTHLDARTIAGIRAFVAGGVPGLDAERVVVLDDRGLALGADADDGTDVAASLQSALDAAFGAGATIVRVRREPLAEHRDVRTVRRTAIAGAIARTAQDERFASNLKRYSKTNATEDRGSDVRDEHRVWTPDATARLSIAVFVDASRGLDLAKIRDLAGAVAGARAERGDTVAVRAVTFAGTAAANRAAPAPAWLLAFASALPEALVAGAIVLAAAFGARPFARAVVRIIDVRAARSAAGAAAGLPPVRLRGALAGEPPHVAAAIISALPTATAAAVLELYPSDERAQIVRRLVNGPSALVPDATELLRG